MKLFLTALGCRLNQAEIEMLARDALALGCRIVETPAAADWAVINTCTVTHVAARKSRQAIRRLRRKNPALRIAVIGCYGEIAPAEARALDGVDLVLPNAQKEQVLQRLLAATRQGAPPSTKPAVQPPPGSRTRAFVKVQDGCDNRCAYCIVTVARGPSRSRLPQQVLADVRRRLEEGAQEVVLSGVNIGAYGQDLPGQGPLPRAEGWSLARLVRRILADTHVPRLRLSSIEPWDLDAELLSLWPHPRLCRQLHLPLQSGSDAVLRRMARPMDAASYRALVVAARERVPEIMLSTDLIVGFPGETEADYAATLRLVEDLALARLHVFRFSPRAGTAAARMPGAAPPDAARARSERLIALGQELALAYHRRFVGETVQVLFEAPTMEEGRPGWSGLSDHYLRVWAPEDGDLRNRMADVRCESADAKGLRGVLV
jgi:threonylcarbamoyladenosine tRNA methylthiotransferase MtaB